jgi:hypothetical protein
LGHRSCKSRVRRLALAQQANTLEAIHVKGGKGQKIVVYSDSSAPG